MKNIILNSAFTIVVSLFAPTVLAQTKPFELEQKWEIQGFNNPESVIPDKKNNVLYVSNVNGNPGDKDGNGYISKISTDGKMLSLKWIDGLNAPKGMVIHKSKLYVADIDAIVVIDIDSGEKVNSFPAQGAIFLNDLTIDKSGNIYASNTFGFSAIFQLNAHGKREVKPFIKDENLQMPNGLYADGDYLLVAPWGKGFDPNTYKTETPGSLLSISLKNKKITSLSNPIGNLDGIEKTIHGFIMTDWLQGKLYYWKKGENTLELLDLPQGSADLAFDAQTKTIYIPLMNDNKVVAYMMKN